MFKRRVCAGCDVISRFNLNDSVTEFALPLSRYSYRATLDKQLPALPSAFTVLIKHKAQAVSRAASSRLTTPSSYFIYSFKSVVAPEGSTPDPLTTLRDHLSNLKRNRLYWNPLGDAGGPRRSTDPPPVRSCAKLFDM